MAEVTLGGDRLGSGQKQTVELHNYGMNSFNLEQDWKSSMAPGVLYPCLKLVGTNHGTFDVDIESFIRTIPTRGPLFGSFKFQVDLFAIPFRLYQGILHNNPTDIGLNMNQVYLPKMLLTTVDGNGKPKLVGSNEDNEQVNESALLKYLGLSGWGHNKALNTITTSTRKLQCVPVLAYYDIFKNYYSNKQEENAYVITPGLENETETVYTSKIQFGVYINAAANTPAKINQNWDEDMLTIFYDQNIEELIKLGYIRKSDLLNDTEIMFGNSDFSVSTAWSLNDVIQNGRNDIIEIKDNYIKIYWRTWYWDIEGIKTDLQTNDVYMQLIENNIDYVQPSVTASIALTPFELKNIDKMRYKILATNELGSEFIIKQGSDDAAGTWDETSGEDGTGLPYSAIIKQTDAGITWNAFTMNGLLVKTYQSDLFNNWLQSDFVDMVTNMTKVDTTSGGFTMDTLNLQEKFYNLLNRIIVGSGTYQDWQEAVYGEGAVRICESPMYIGGMSSEVMFEEVISTAETNVNNDKQPLGSLGGRGREMGKKGGANIHCKCEEPSYIMAICSLTPRIVYTQGNDWDITELDTLDDLHKPELDGIGFQDLILEQFAWWNTALNTDGSLFFRGAAGKQTAWINYQTAVDKAYGDFAKKDGYSFMVLNRNYEHKENTVHGVDDVTTYIDPAKYNYAFAYSKLDAQNFWVQIHFKITARRKMGAQQLPNL